MRRPFFRHAMAAVIAAGFVVTASASTGDTPDARRAAAVALVQTMNKLMGPERMLQTMRGAMEAPLLQQVRADARFTPAQQNRIVEVLGQAMGEAMGEIFKQVLPAMTDAMTQVYAERFSLDELQTLARFYDSPVGVKSVVVMQEDLPRLMQPMMQAMQQHAPRLHQRMESAREQLAKEGIELKPPAAPR